MFNSCCNRYAHLLPPDTKEGLQKEKGAVAQLRYLCQKCMDAGQRIEVREMLGYYASVLPFNHTVDELIQVMKPWYDNYCFALKSYGRTTMYNSVMVLNFIDKYIRNEYDIPDSMVESNVRTDYNKLRMLIRHDKEFAHDASIIQQLVTKGFVTGNLVENFPAESINDPDNFVSLLFYFGMVTIGGTHDGATKFVIPNEVVRDQLYTYLLDTYNENDLTYDTYGKGQLASRLAYQHRKRFCQDHDIA